MILGIEQLKTAFRKFVVEGVPASGPNEPDKSEILTGLNQLGSDVSALAAQAGLGALVDVIKETEAALDGDLAHAADTIAMVYGDASEINNDLYAKVGAPGTGSWTNTGALHSIMEGLAQPYVDEMQAISDGVFDFILTGFGTDQLVGRKGDPVTGDAAAEGPLAYVINRSFPAYSLVEGFKVFGGSAGGNATIAAFTKTGNDFAQQGSGVPITVAAGILNDYDDIVIRLPAGQMLGLIVADSVTARYSSTLPVDDGGWYNGTAPNFTDAAPTTGDGRLEWSFTVRALDASSSGGREPLSIVADGNSLTEGSGGVTAWPSLLASQTGAPVNNLGVSGQNLNQMIADFDSQVAPLAIQDGYRTLYIIDGEPYNLLRMGVDTVSQAVAKMKTLADMAFDAGFDYVAVVNSAAHNTSTDVAVEGNWNRATTKAAVNAEIVTVFAGTQVILVDIGSAPQLSDYTDTGYYQVDEVHFSQPGQDIVFKRVSAKVAVLL